MDNSRQRNGNFFTVDHPDYIQMPGYEAFCQGAVRMLHQRNPLTLTQAVKLIGDQTNEYYKTAEHSLGGSFGTVRDIEQINITRSSQYQQALIGAALEKRLGTEKEAHHEIRIALPEWYQPPTGDKPEALLTRFVPENGAEGTKYSIEHFHSPGEKNSSRAEAVWSVCSGYYDRAMGHIPDNDPKKAALACYSLLSHDMPFDRGSSTMGRILLAYLLEKNGYELAMPKKNTDLNIEALVRNTDEFIRDFDGFFNTPLALGQRAQRV